MKITELFSAIFPMVKKADPPRVAASKPASSQLLKRRDEVKLADDAKFIAALRTELKKSDATREQKLLEIQKKIDEGTYSVDSMDLAKKILGE